MRAGSTLVGFEVRGGKAAAFRCLNALKLSRISNNLGDAKSLVTHPSTTTHQRLTPEARAELGISEGFIRFSAGHLLIAEGICHTAQTRVLGVWVPAFAGTTLKLV